MALDFTVIVNVRHQFGSEDQNIGVFAGIHESFTFACPSVASEQALLFFQSAGVSTEQKLSINNVRVFGGVPMVDPVLGFTGGPSGGQNVPFHSHALVGVSLGWVANVMIINAGALRDTDNVLEIASSGDSFVIDNVVVLYKTRPRGATVADDAPELLVDD